MIRKDDPEVNMKLWEVILNQLGNCGIYSRLAYSIRRQVIVFIKVGDDTFKMINTAEVRLNEKTKKAL